MGLAVVPRRWISMEGNSAVSLSLLEKPEHKLNLVESKEELVLISQESPSRFLEFKAIFIG